ncbi:hypothetical protein ALC62_08581 [Cyphomyrmex costatus]|uniref:GIY-YIG domain-containing protein n=1 Tax=Cyphomyrmex costatus TaxID=456900 RepID=A0A151IGU8_9HYME|nr:hypothetical protein ALC62_08581 [Cyphomyrmex costatus]
MAVPREQINTILQNFNNYHHRLQFTIEIGGDRINFLDTTMIIKNNFIQFDWFQKPTYSGRILNFWSQHPLSQKISVIYGLVDKAFLLSHPEFHKKNLKFIIDILMLNDYPLDFIFEKVNKRIYAIMNKPSQSEVVNNNNIVKNNTFWFTIPYAKGISDGFRNMINGINDRIAFFSINKLNNFIKVQKDRLPHFMKKNIVYKIQCGDCDATYVGQTKRMLKTRVNEHRSHIRRNTSSRSVITEHRLQHGHDFDWNNVEVLDDESFYHKRLISEMLHIKSQNNGLNLKTDTEGLDRSYIDILENLTTV